MHRGGCNNQSGRTLAAPLGHRTQIFRALHKAQSGPLLRERERILAIREPPRRLVRYDLNLGAEWECEIRDFVSSGEVHEHRYLQIRHQAGGQPPAAPAKPPAAPQQPKFKDVTVNSQFYFLADTNRAFAWTKTSDTTARNTKNGVAQAINGETPIQR